MQDDIHDELAALLLSRLELTLADDKSFSRAPRLPAHAPTNRLILASAGPIEYFLGTRKIILQTGDALLVPAWSVRRWSLPAGQSCHMTWCEFIVRPPRPGGIPAMAGKFSCEIDIASIVRIRTALAAADDLLAEGELKALLARFFAKATVISTPVNTRTADPSSAEATIEAALSWLHKHYAESFSLDDLANRAQLSPRQFREQFATLVGMSPRQYITALRMYDAKFRLRSSEQSVKQIALAVGYSDPLYFSRHYKQYWGHAPGKRKI